MKKYIFAMLLVSLGLTVGTSVQAESPRRNAVKKVKKAVNKYIRKLIIDEILNLNNERFNLVKKKERLARLYIERLVRLYIERLARLYYDDSYDSCKKLGQDFTAPSDQDSIALLGQEINSRIAEIDQRLIRLARLIKILGR